jgi:hypothetical protein
VVVVFAVETVVCEATLKWFESIASHNNPNSTAAQKNTTNAVLKPRGSDLAIATTYEALNRPGGGQIQPAFTWHP